MTSALFWNILGTVLAALLIGLFTGVYKWVKHSLDAEDTRRSKLDRLWADYEMRCNAADH